jgi:hypothetical protein
MRSGIRAALRDVRVLLAASPVPCPSERCPMCSGEACARCGAGMTQYGQPNGRPCQHDVLERHDAPEAA